MNKSLLILAPLLAAFAVSPALADKGGKGHGNKGKGKGKHQVVVRDANYRAPIVIRDRDAPRPVVVFRDRDGRYDHDDHAGHPPGRHLGWHKNEWRRGDRIDWTYVDRSYYITDYRAYNLRQPDPGYRWVRPMDDRYLLVEVATGLIIDALGY